MKNPEMRESVDRIYRALLNHGYRPIDQIVGYILTDDPTYITNYNNARRLVSGIDRDDLLKDMLLDYFENMGC